MNEKNNDQYMALFSDFFKEESNGEVSATPSSDEILSSVSASRQILNLLLMIDVSGSMRGQRIAQVNYALENIIKELRTHDDVNSVIKIGIMEFSNTAKWITPKPILLDDYIFTQMEAKPKLTLFSKAFEALDEVLSSRKFMDPALGEYFAPLILFITDGEPVDENEYPQALEKLKQNKWFKKSVKYAIAVGEESRNGEMGDILSRFTDVKENVRYADEGDALCDLIEFIAVRASEVQTSMISVGSGTGSSIFSELDNSLFSKL